MAKPHTPHPRHLHPSAYGGVLRKSRLGRGARSISTRYSMHIVLRSTHAQGDLSFVRPNIKHMIETILTRYSHRFGVKILGLGNAGNHLHLHVKIATRADYLHFVRAVTGVIALKIKRQARKLDCPITAIFWDRRPFSSIVSTPRYTERLNDFIKVNQLEGRGYVRAFARLVVQKWRERSLPIEIFSQDVVLV